MLLATFFVAGSLVWHMPMLLNVTGFEFRRILYPTIYQKMNHNSGGFYSGSDVGFLPALCIAFAAIVAHTMQRVTLKQICNVASLAQICNVASLAQQCSKANMHTCTSTPFFSHVARASFTQSLPQHRLRSLRNKQCTQHNIASNEHNIV